MAMSSRPPHRSYGLDMLAQVSILTNILDAKLAGSGAGEERPGLGASRMLPYLKPAPQDDEPPSAFRDWFSAEMEAHWGEGMDDGALLLSVPPGLLRGQDTSEQETIAVSPTTPAASTFRADRLFNCFALDRVIVDGDVEELTHVLTKRSEQPMTTYADLVQRLMVDSGLDGARYYVDMDANDELRRRLGIRTIPLDELNGGSLCQTEHEFDGIHTPYLYANCTDVPSPFHLHVEDYHLYSLNYLHGGAPKNWVVVKPSHRRQLERKLKSYESIASRGQAQRPARCSQFVRHLALWVPTETLDLWGIEYTRLTQTAGDLVVTAPGAYHEGWNAGPNVAEAVNYGDAHSERRSQDYAMCTEECAEGIIKITWPKVGQPDLG